MEMSVEELNDYCEVLQEYKTLSKDERTIINRVKRKLKNKESARKSRQKIKDQHTTMQQQLDDVRMQNSHLIQLNNQLLGIIKACSQCSERCETMGDGAY